MCFDQLGVLFVVFDQISAGLGNCVVVHGELRQGTVQYLVDLGWIVDIFTSFFWSMLALH